MAGSRVDLTSPILGPRILESVVFYANSGRWWPTLFLLMPDHCHALLQFPVDQMMGTVVGDWKRYHTSVNGLQWQEGFFDHRLRNMAAITEKEAYIRNNPVVKQLCASPEDWPWVLSL